MAVIVVVQPKGGVGKSTLATHIAGYWANAGHAVALGDADRQQSARLWLERRDPQWPAIAPWDLSQGLLSGRPRGSTRVVVDTPAGLDGWRMDGVLKMADKILVPLQPGVFDIFATEAFLQQLQAHRHASHFEIGLVGTRVTERSRAAQQMQRFVEGVGLPLVTRLRNTQNYGQWAAQGISLFDLSPHKVARDLEQWQPLLDWLPA